MVVTSALYCSAATAFDDILDSDILVITSINSTYGIKIGGRKVSKNSTFKKNDKIEWNNDDEEYIIVNRIRKNCKNRSYRLSSAQFNKSVNKGSWSLWGFVKSVFCGTMGIDEVDISGNVNTMSENLTKKGPWPFMENELRLPTNLNLCEDIYVEARLMKKTIYVEKDCESNEIVLKLPMLKSCGIKVENLSTERLDIIIKHNGITYSIYGVPIIFLKKNN